VRRAVGKGSFWYIVGFCSAPEAFKLTRLVSLKGKLNSPFSFSQNHVVLLRHVALSDEIVMPSKTGPLGGLARSAVDYVNREEYSREQEEVSI
jgi:hypothetical protein